MRPLLLLLILLAACGSPEEPAWYVAFDFRFPTEPSDEASEAIGKDGAVIHWLEGDWARPGSHGMWLLEDGATLCADLEEADSRLTLRVQTRRELSNAGQTLTVLVNDIELTRIEVPAWGAGESLALEIPAAWFGSDIDRIDFECSTHLEEDGKAPFAVMVHELRLEQFGQRPQSKPSDGWWDQAHWEATPIEAAPVSADPSTPDVLVVVLDAARADHFGAYGYERETTPFIDSLADESLVFDDLHSVAPFTRCSMPSFLTGIPWFVHGMVANDSRLPEGLLTAADMFGQMGYQRLALSESPHVSTATALDRGFDTFWESWTHPDAESLAGRHFLISLFSKLLDEQLDESPAFVLVHMIPPHVPYIPTDAFDLWTEDDPQKKWTSVGAGDLKAMRRKNRVLSESEHRRLIALYDGNLRRGDDLTRRLVEHWRGLGRERPLRILITSDHGEALGEHGFFGHNFSLYTEMTRIPGIFWPRSAFEEWAGREEELWSNEDLMAILLRSVGWQPAERAIVPRPFAEIVAGSDYQRPAVMMRSLPEVGARTSSSLLSFDRRRGPREFDLEGDRRLRKPRTPGVDADLPTWVRGYSQLLRGTAPAPPDSLGELSAPDSERLRALGYID